MKHGYFAVIGCACLLGLALISCDPVGAVDIGVEDQTSIYEYLDAGQQGLITVDFELNEDQDGNRSKRLQIYALQNLAFHEQSGFYENLDFSASPSSVTVSGTGFSGLYKSHFDNAYHGFTAYSNPISRQSRSSISFQVASSDEFNYVFTCQFSSPRDCWVEPVTRTSDNGGIIIDNTIYDNGARSNIAWTLIDTRGRYSNGSGSFLDYYNNYAPLLINPAEYSISYPFRPDRYFGYNTNPYFSIGFSSQSVSLPTGTIDTNAPWDYYNNVLLPYLEEEFPGYDEYFLFPDGYVPPEPPPQVPTEFPTLPGYDFDIQPNGTLPVDAGNTAYDMPDVPVKVVPVPSFDLTKINPAEIIAPFANGLQGIWALISDTLVSFDLLPVVSLCFLVLIITAFLALGVK